MKILLVEDEKGMLSFLKNHLKCSGFSVNTAYTGQKGLDLALTNSHDLIVLDLNLPDISGLEVCQKIRQAKLAVPILILSGEDKISSKTLLLDSGADDYLTKPFCFSELAARINALLRRPANISENIIKIDGLELDIKKQKVKRGTKEINLTRTEYLILELLLSKRGTIISRGEIMEKVWDDEADIFSKAIETHILNIRNKIDKNKKTKIIETITGRGYKIS